MLTGRNTVNSAYLGNQQFTSRNLIFRNCLTAVQIHWDWAWTMQGVTVIGRGISSGSPSTGITIVGGVCYAPYLLIHSTTEMCSADKPPLRLAAAQVARDRA